MLGAVSTSGEAGAVRITQEKTRALTARIAKRIRCSFEPLIVAGLTTVGSPAR